MSKKIHLQTIRFSPGEWSVVERYLKENRFFESFSSLARVATLSFMRDESIVRLHPVSVGMGTNRPRFLWDYDLSEVQVKEILRTPGLPPKKRWLMERILTQARFDETLEYLDVDKIKRALPSLRLPNKIRDRWTYAIERWSHYG